MIDAARRASLYLSIAGLAAALGLLLATGSVGIALAGTLGIGVLLVQAVELLGFRAITAWVVPTPACSVDVRPSLAALPGRRAATQWLASSDASPG
jgi:hypothetical protein